MSKGRIGAILLHDATLTNFQVLAGGVVLLHFDGVSVYRSVTPDLEDIWIHSARLCVEGVTEIFVHGPPWIKDDDDYVLEDIVINSKGKEIQWAGIEGESIQQIDLVIFSGARITVKGSRAALALSRKRELVGHWEGPLVGGGGRRRYIGES